MAQIIISLSRLTALQKVARAFLVVTGLRGNPYVPDGEVLADDLEAAGQDLQNAITNTQSAKDAWMAAALMQSNLEKELDSKYAATGTEVQRVTGGNEMKIDTTKFEVRKTPGASHEMPKVEEFTLTMGDEPGEVDSHWHNVPNVQSYATQFHLGIEVPTAAQWQNGPPLGRKSSATLKDLPSGSRVWQRVCAVGALGAGPWSEAAYTTVP